MTDEDDVSDASPQPLTFPLPDVPASQGPPSIPFPMLLDFSIQKTYQDLTVLVELSPKKSDIERKVSIVQFAFSARQLFIRLLAVVKWARSGTKFDVCTAITCYLDQQASTFVDTADRLFAMSRDVLSQALLPSFQIPAAVDVLSLGKYLRLPLHIKNRFITEETVSPKEQRSVLNRMNQVIENRLFSIIKLIPRPMRNFSVRNGTVKFCVLGEFEVSATLLGQRPSTPWTLLNLKILVEDTRLSDGADLLHPTQTTLLHQLLQTR
ncbi:unnamed protein product [Soboliphyme baturini]|uniref:Mediator of RNA polymerase II transcription subunit 14 n=1 Tax=Soboliphyme baturini TaxID=241478 RepID=A0A183IS04_9BILA|nr:unnamed protein product [Soboliphyme baturini]